MSVQEALIIAVSLGVAFWSLMLVIDDVVGAILCTLGMWGTFTLLIWWLA